MRQANPGESEHDYMRDARLPNWGFCGRLDSCKPNPQRISAGIYLMGKSDGKPTVVYFRCQSCRKEQPDEGACCGSSMVRTEERITPEPEPEPPDMEDAARLEFFIKQMDALHKSIIRAKYYLHQDIIRTDLDASVRALMDRMADNRRVVDAMKRLGWT